MCIRDRNAFKLDTENPDSAFCEEGDILFNEAVKYLKAGVINRKARQRIKPIIPNVVIETLKIELKLTNNPAAITEPGTAYPEEDKVINNLNFLALIKLKASIIEIETVKNEATIPSIMELRKTLKLLSNEPYSLSIAQSIT